MASMGSGFTLTVDWLAFTLPEANRRDVIEVLGGDWSQAKAGFRGYPVSWILCDGSRGVGKLGTGKPTEPFEVHVDLSGGIVSSWPLEKLQAVLRWVLDRQGHLTRLDCALDDREPVATVEQIKAAVDQGQCVTRAERFQALYGSSLSQGTATGQTLYFGSPQSHTLLRVYDKRLELHQKERADWEAFGVRWELELRKERAQACGQALITLSVEDWLEYVVTVLRGYVDFRDTTRDASTVDRCRAPLLPWWQTITDGFAKGRLVVEQSEQTIQDVKRWITSSVAPMLAVVCASPEAGQPWLINTIVNSTSRWKKRHLRLARGKRGPSRSTQVPPPPIT